MLAGEGAHVGSLHYGREVQSISGLPNQPFICLAVPSTKLVVEMGDEKLPSVLFCQVINYVQQDNRIQAARNRDQHRLAPPKQLAPLDVFADPSQKLTHGIMLFRRHCQAKQNGRTEGSRRQQCLTGYGKRVTTLMRRREVWWIKLGEIFGMSEAGRRPGGPAVIGRFFLAFLKVEKSFWFN